MKNHFFAILLLVAPVLSLLGQNKRNPLNKEEQIGNFSGIVYDLCFSQSGRMLVIPQGNQIYLYDVRTNDLIKRMDKGHTKPILSIDLSVDSTLLVSGGLDSLILIWDIQSGKPINRLHYHHGVITTLSLNPDHSLLASGSSDRSVVLYDLIGRKIAYRIDNFNADITAVKFSPDGSLLAVASMEKQIRLYNTRTGNQIALLEGHKKGVRNLCFNRQGTQLFSCGDDSRLITWNILNLNQIRIWKNESYGSDWLLSVDASRLSDAQAVAGLDSKIYVITDYGTTVRKIGIPVDKLLFQPGSGEMIKIALATRGRGVYLINTMEFDEKPDPIR